MHKTANTEGLKCRRDEPRRGNATAKRRRRRRRRRYCEVTRYSEKYVHAARVRKLREGGRGMEARGVHDSSSGMRNVEANMASSER